MVLPGSDGPDVSARLPNRLSREKSPYLLQHAYNPVDWYPWGEDAFHRAKKEDIPVFLSIGYASCHWCHVMEEESFGDPVVAALLNSSFVCVKVDREERPDIDHLYMTACQMLTGSGGWPLTLLLTPEKEPFFAATYIPKESRFGASGLLDLVPRLRSIWDERRGEVVRVAEEITRSLCEPPQDNGSARPDKTTLTEAYRDLASRFDRVNGGFGRSPKFPEPHLLLFLLRYWNRTGEESALRMVELTLDKIDLGGIHDHVGSGFHRYSTDEAWLVPHFEKMLCDQALIAMACTEAYLATGSPRYEKMARDCLGYVLSDLVSPEGAFYSSEDADSGGEEGRYYLWTSGEITGCLGEEAGRVFSLAYGVTPSGNFPGTGTGRTGENVLHLTAYPDTLAGRLGMDRDHLSEVLARSREVLRSERNRRERPARDDKVIADWNGLMVAALAKAGRGLSDPSFTDAAARAARFILDRMRPPDGGLFHRFRDGEAAIPGRAGDYAAMVLGLVELHLTTMDPSWLDHAVKLTRYLVDHFGDKVHGGFFLTPSGENDLPVRQKDLYDGAVPSTNSIGFLDLLLLTRITGAGGFEEEAGRIAGMFSQAVRSSPSSYGYFLCGLDYAIGPSHEVHVRGDLSSQKTKKMVDTLHASYIPSTLVLLRRQEAATQGNETGGIPDGQGLAEVCSGRACMPGLGSPGEVLSLVGARRKVIVEPGKK
ncbi:MAG: thioredoxin domain-containing protein [Methanoregulaceae archaeon]|nr:thioredoxin domain-containing protein [Methanoregulaceae archaeon]